MPTLCCVRPHGNAQPSAEHSIQGDTSFLHAVTSKPDSHLAFLPEQPTTRFTVANYWCSGLSRRRSCQPPRTCCGVVDRDSVGQVDTVRRAHSSPMISRPFPRNPYASGSVLSVCSAAGSFLVLHSWMRDAVRLSAPLNASDALPQLPDGCRVPDVVPR